MIFVKQLENTFKLLRILGRGCNYQKHIIHINMKTLILKLDFGARK